MPYRPYRLVVRPWIRLFAGLAAAFFLWGCAAKAPGPRSRMPATYRPYTVKGVTYTPMLSAKGYREEGVASWYGPGFHGHRTSSGEVYDQNEPTCAHKLLPMQTMVRVTNLENGRSCVLRVNDRGPFVSGRVVDLSLLGAKLLGIYGRGTAKVLVQVQGDVPGALPDGALPGPFYVQVGAFSQRDRADRLLARLVSAGYAGSRIDAKEIDGVLLYRVHAGIFTTESAAEDARVRLATAFSGAFVLAR